VLLAPKAGAVGTAANVAGTGTPAPAANGTGTGLSNAGVLEMLRANIDKGNQRMPDVDMLRNYGALIPSFDGIGSATKLGTAGAIGGLGYLPSPQEILNRASFSSL